MTEYRSFQGTFRRIPVDARPYLLSLFSIIITQNTFDCKRLFFRIRKNADSIDIQFPERCRSGPAADRYTAGPSRTEPPETTVPVFLFPSSPPFFSRPAFPSMPCLLLLYQQGRPKNKCTLPPLFPRRKKCIPAFGKRAFCKPAFSVFSLSPALLSNLSKFKG